MRHSLKLCASERETDTKLRQYFSSKASLFPKKTKQQMLGADSSTRKQVCFLCYQIQRTLRRLVEWNFPRAWDFPTNRFPLFDHLPNCFRCPRRTKKAAR